MASGWAISAWASAAPLAGAEGSVYRERIWRAPLVGVALAVTAGIVLDRFVSIPLAFSLLVAVAALLAWGATQPGEPRGLALIYLALAGAAVGAGYHRWHGHVYSPDDIGHHVSAELRPVQLRGILDEEPVPRSQRANRPLQSLPRSDVTTAVVRVTQLKQGNDWLPASGRAQLRITGQVADLHLGDEVEIIGGLTAPQGATNPGEIDYASSLRERQVRACAFVQGAPGAVTRLTSGRPWSFHRWLATVRGWGLRELQSVLPPSHSGLATVLLLGESAAMTGEDWEKYTRTGVVHALAISGQHLVVLAVFLGWTLRLLRVRRRWWAGWVALFLVGYALMVGARPPVLRASVSICAFYGGFLLHRTVLPANSYALAWLLVVLLNPTNVFGPGCQLSFLAVALLYWGMLRWMERTADPLERLVEEARPAWQQGLRWLGRVVVAAYALNLMIWLAAAPLLAARSHVVAPAGLLIGPPVTLLTSISLITGFLLLLTAALSLPLVPLLAWLTQGSLSGCEFLVNLGESLPGGYWYVPGVPDWWLWAFYAALFALLTQPRLRLRWRWAVVAGLAWLCVGLLSGSARLPSNELRATFLAVGHGGCTVLETPDGRTLLYDAGAMSGPDVTRHKIAPFLWHRGIRRIDEVFLSHADLDHFNGLSALLDRFAVGQITCTPTFADRATPGVRHTLEVLDRRRIPLRTVRAGDRLEAGTVAMLVLHPPAAGPEGEENVRSLVLLVRHAGHSLLLTGDLEGLGLERVLALPPVPVDVLMAPHHGSRTANQPELAAWARPKLVVSCEGPPRGPTRAPEPYTAAGARFLGTWPHGAVTVRSHVSGLVVETFQTGERFVVR
jgi:competence protein ComEC